MTPNDDGSCEPTTTADCPQHKPEPEMPYFVGVKVIQAMPMWRRDFLRRRGPEPDLSIEDQPGYLVRYPDGYESWSPAKAFEEAYTFKANKEIAERIAAEVKAILILA